MSGLFFSPSAARSSSQIVGRDAKAPKTVVRNGEGRT